MLPPSETDSQSAGFAGSLTSQSAMRESNTRCSAPKADALPLCKSPVRGAGIAPALCAPEAQVLLLNTTLWCTVLVSHQVLRLFRPALSLD
jgi:hypothetical protein